MKRCVSVFTLSMLMLFCTACDTSTFTRPSRYELTPNLHLREFSEDTMNTYDLLVCEETGVLYIRYGAGYKGGITALLNADGTPYTIEQLESEEYRASQQTGSQKSGLEIQEMGHNGYGNDD